MFVMWGEKGGLYATIVGGKFTAQVKTALSAITWDLNTHDTWFINTVNFR